MRRLVIAGAGNAGMACIEQILKFKHQCAITVFECATGLAKLDQSHREWLRKNEVEVRPAVCVEAIDRHAKVVRSCDGSRTTFDRLILAGGGSIPALGRDAGLEVRSGVVVNDFMETSDAHVYALGEGVEHRGSVYSDPETVEEQARVLAAHLTGNATVPFKRSLANLLSAVSAIKTCAGLPNASADSARRSEDQTLPPANRPALFGAA